MKKRTSKILSLVLLLGMLLSLVPAAAFAADDSNVWEPVTLAIFEHECRVKAHLAHQR